MLLREWTLVLNRFWIPINVTTVLRALCKLYDGSARVVDPADYVVYDFSSWIDVDVPEEAPCIRTPSIEIPIPEVIVLTRYGGIPAQGLAFTRWNLFKRDRYTCQYCGLQPGAAELTIDHLLPRSRGGTSDWDNCVVACIVCNSRKGSRTVQEAGLKLRKDPERPRWSPQLVLGLDSAKESWNKFLSGSQRA